nr:hypothetical protein BaRGS_029145 [Batillaria attramentaria]
MHVHNRHLHTTTLTEDGCRVSEKRGQILPNGVIQYMDMDHDGCEKACASEIKIVCNYFKFDKATKNCYLSATINPGGNRTANGQGGLMSDLSAKVDELQSKATDMEDMKGTLSEMRQELNLLKRRHKADVERQKESKQQEDNVVDDLATKMKTLSAEGEKFKAALHALSNMQRALAKEIGTLKDEDKTTTMKINELQKSSQYLETLTNSLGATDSTLQRELDAVKDTMNDIATKLNKLHAHLDKPSTPDRLTPAIVKLKRNQGALATALESMSDKVSSLVARMPFMEKEVRSTNQKVSNEAVFAQELQGKLKVLYKNVVELKKAIHQLEDPRSAINMQRSKGVMKLKSDVSMLAQVDKTLQNELKDQKEDVANLVRDVAKVQLQAQNLQDKLSLVLTASRQFESEIAVLKKAQKSGMSVVEVAQMQKQVVVALTRLKTRETILMKQLDKYRESVRDIAEKVRL